MYNFNEWLKNPPIKIVNTTEESIDNSVKLPKTKFKILKKFCHEQEA